MKRILCICNTYYQLIFSLQLKKTIYANDYFVLLLSDHSQKSAQICQRLEQQKNFEEIKNIESKDIDYFKYGNLFTTRTLKKHLSGYLNNLFFDELLIYNMSKSAYLYFSCLYERNKQVIVNRYEEGVLSYNTPVYRQIPLTSSWYINRSIYPVCKVLRKYDMAVKLERFYCYYPQLYSGNLSAEKIQLINCTSDLGDTIVKSFDVNRSLLVYKEKYIFFTSVYDFEGGEAIGELELVRSIADVVGKENLLIKMHPRDTRTAYADEGFHIDTNSFVPFEALLFAYDFSDKVLLTATSGAVLSASLMLENPPETYYMYPLCKFDGNPMAQITIEQIDQVLCHESMRDQLQKIHVCSCVRDIVH